VEWQRSFSPKIVHRDVKNLTIKARYRYAPDTRAESYPDFRLIAGDIKDFLTNYPNKTDYWEVINKKLTSLILRKYTPLSSVRIEMQVSPTGQDPYLRSSIVTRDRSSLGADRKRRRRGKHLKAHITRAEYKS
jgi:hypothetical protein